MTITTRPQAPRYDDVIDLDRYEMKLSELTQKLFYGRTV
jgi:hypothetical protein